MAGFGISTPGQAAQIAAMADGVVVGSAIVKLFQEYSGTKLRTELKQFVRALKQAIS
jgi:tryptophan synthase alpha chain